ncbi:MAG: ABC transporter permease [Alphaproteobacteria bacterium]|nr:ABC transporter permease [Alphaproteobacteria bacterium]
MTSPVIESEAGSFFPSWNRVCGLALRHVYLYMGSWPRLVEMMYWPILNIAMFGFISLAIVKRFGQVDVVTDTYLGGLLLGEILTRVQIAMLIFFMEEIWSRNLGHLFASPLRLRDYIGGVFAFSAFRCFISVAPAFAVAYFLFDFSILKFGWILPVYLALLCFNGWCFGTFIVSLLLRFGLAAEWLGWMCSWLLMPFMAPYYPVSILPQSFQYVSWALPGTYVFESMKSQVETGRFRADYLGLALVLNLAYFVVAMVVFKRSFNSAKRTGRLLQMGE